MMTLRLLLPLASVVFAAQQTPPGQLYKEAVALYEKGEIEQAIAKYEQLVKAGAGSVEVRTNLGVALVRLGRYGEAISQYEAALALNANSAMTRLNLALAWYKQSEFDKAAVELRTVYDRHPGNRQVLYLLADCYLRLGGDKDVIALLAPLDAADSRDRTISYLLGAALLHDGDITKGQVIIDRILRDGESPEANLLMGEAQLAAREYGQALASIQKAIAGNPKLPGAYTLCGRTQMELNEVEAAEASFRKALEIDSTDFEANLNLGAILRRGGNLDDAAAHLARAVRLRPGSLAARFQLGVVMMSLNKLDEALTHLETVARESPDFQDVHVQLTVLYHRLGRKADSERERAVVLKLNEKARDRD